MSTLPTLTPITSAWMQELMEEKTVLNELLAKHGSPINIHQTDAMAYNFNSYRKVFEEFGLKYKIFFARKANKTKGVVQKAHALGMGIDTASYQEYAQCLDMGIPPSDLIVTAAVKNRKLVEKAIQNGSLLILDNEDECALVQAVASAQDKKAKIGFRVSGFFVNEKKLYSRFGFDLLDIDDFISANFLGSEKFNYLEYKGLHFHLNGYSIEERSYALTQCLAFSQLLSKKGMKTEFIDIGGGILMNYLKYETEWEYFHQQLRKAVSRKVDPITYGNQGLGFEAVNGDLHGELKTYPFWNAVSKGDFLREILSYKIHSSENLAEVSNNLSIEIRMEPGRSMLDQVGVTVAKVAFRKQDSTGDWLVGLEMNMTQMLSGSADFLLDPFVLYQEEQSEEQPVEVYFTGAYCLERDILLKRKIALPNLPQVGDLVIFVNTAGYMMHFFESSAHLFPLATNLIWNRSTENGRINSAHFQNDENL
ncbi:type III PLP-dependent enzyme domain-containing protein [Algoriphagus antarcticus]|uniref:Diaminopimelate decarboxylase n=1 Tax=Algoriphagus antarcticus TaxID=238540 RepID=A0A3E0DV68_9BACT|nr:diaminopimelate decarboxylase [Algoriphagus antarcticus]REG88321.1 diaminopimelate decarboxylase [Algoriphagus antarcticus]